MDKDDIPSIIIEKDEPDEFKQQSKKNWFSILKSKNKGDQSNNSKQSVP